ncbi:hypothetical protein OGH69_12795 [Flavobacterium sp. MFBS3-15]|uniref:hypothetical protein n=1 Tax=Flavobacterium sp. MFBS3-15 TaxID=2989816 RepID=UPI0022356111|nr:hypothetical protein [Flavobacterium sp. MFBS3-15]MCW4469850.1 hypothetical protein [Flavobacterium sp. MFBS3-15]
MGNILKISLLFLLFSFSGKAQTSVEDTLTASYRYNKARALYIKSLHSKSSMHLNKLGAEFRDKLNFFGDSTVLATREGALKWIKENLERTDFETYEAAVNEYEAIGVASANQVKDNSEFYDYIKYCALYHKEYSLLPDVCLDVHSSNPELLDLYKKYE